MNRSNLIKDRSEKDKSEKKTIMNRTNLNKDSSEQEQSEKGQL